MDQKPARSTRLTFPPLLRKTGLLLLWLGSILVAVSLLSGFTYFIGNSGEWLKLSGETAEWWSLGLRVIIAVIFAFSTFWLLFHPRRTLRFFDRLWKRLLSWFRPRPGSFPAKVAEEIARDLDETEQVVEAAAEPRHALKPISRRRFVTEAVLVGAFTVDTFFLEPTTPAITRLDVRLPYLPPAFEGLTIAQLSDIHIDPYTPAEMIGRMVAQVNALKPDLTFVTGDFISRGTYYFEQAAQTLGKLRDGTRLGLYGVSGNHDHWSDGDDLGRIEPLFKKYGLPLLRNTATKIELNGDSLWLLGTDDSSTHNDDWQKTLRAANFLSEDALRRHEGTSILLSHNPSFSRKAIGASPDLLLAGHTHGGQVYVPFVEDLLLAPFVPQLHSYYKIGDRMQVYVNRGAGVVGPPMRLLSQPEILLLRLVKA